MKRLLIVLLTLLMMTNECSFFQHAKAENITQNKEYLEIIYSNVKVRTGPGTSYNILSVGGKYQYYDLNEVLEVLGSSVNSSGELWYKVKKIINNNSYEVWVRQDFVILYHYEYDEKFEEELEKEKFPVTYANYLRYLHTKRPDWKFKAYHTNIEWKDILAAESTLGRSLVDGSNVYLRSKESGCYNPTTGAYIPLDGNNWYQANSEAIQYFMDPRNFLNEEDIFQFIKLSFNENETPDLIQMILNGTFMSGTVTINEEEKKYAQIFYDAGEEAKVSPIYLAVKAINEQGTTGSAAVTGAAFSYNGKTYSSLYNFYNIQATSGVDNWKYGLIYANGGESGKNTSYGRPWNNQEKSIIGGALWIADGYIVDGQDTLYSQKFNYVNKQYWHQYQTNIKAPSTECLLIYKSYKNAKCLDRELTFNIPVYLNMPEKTYLPNGKENPSTIVNKYNIKVNNPYPENIKITGEGEYEENKDCTLSIETDENYEFVGWIIDDEIVSEEKNYTFKVTKNQEFGISVKAMEVDPQEPENPENPDQVDFSIFIKDFNLNNKNDVVYGFKNEQKWSDIKTIAIEKGVEYELSIKNSNGEEVEENELLSTSMIITVKIGEEIKEYTISIIGDVSGDGKVSPVDYVLVKNHIMDSGKLTEESKKFAADMSGDGNISPVDYVLIKNIIMNGGN